MGELLSLTPFFDQEAAIAAASPIEERSEPRVLEKLPCCWPADHSAAGAQWCL